MEGQVNESVERRNFRRRSQQTGESFDDFLVALRELAKTCKFWSEECTRKNIRDQIIEGLLDGDSTEDLLKEKDLTLDVAIAKCCALEAAKKQRAEMGRTPFEPNVHSLRRNRFTPSPPPLATPTCPGCGAQPHQGGRRQCPAYGVKCHTCLKVGHFARVYKGRRTFQAN